MLNRMWVTPACRNMYVRIVHGRNSAARGTNTMAFASAGIMFWRKNTTMFAARSRRTHGVMVRSATA
jgi:hypothetical protein